MPEEIKLVVIQHGWRSVIGVRENGYTFDTAALELVVDGHPTKTYQLEVVDGELVLTRSGGSMGNQGPNEWSTHR